MFSGMFIFGRDKIPRGSDLGSKYKKGNERIQAVGP